MVCNRAALMLATALLLQSQPWMAALQQAQNLSRQGGYREAVSVGEQRLPAGHPLVKNTLLNHSYVLEKLNRKEEAACSRQEAQVLLAFPRKP